MHGPGTIGTIPLTALASWETEWTSESVFQVQILISFLSAKQRPVIPLELLHQEHNLEKSCRTAARDPAVPWDDCFPSQFPCPDGVCAGWDSVLSQITSDLRAALCWRDVTALLALPLLDSFPGDLHSCS